MPLPLLWVSSAFLLGIVFASLMHFPIFLWLGLALSALVGTILLRRVRSRLPTLHLGTRTVDLQAVPLLLLAASLIFVFLGAARYQAAIPAHSFSQVDWFNDSQYDLLVTGSLVEPPDTRDAYTELRLRARQVNTGRGQFEVDGLLLARSYPNRDYNYGDILRLRGRLETPPSGEEFSYREYLARQGIRSYMSQAEVTILPGSRANPLLAAVYDLKAASLRNVYRLFTDPEASLLAGILLGVDTGLTAKLSQAFQDTGTAHIIAISGFNIAIIAGVFAVLFSRLLGPRRGAFVALAGIVFYTVLVGAEPAVVRAALMGAVTLLAVQVGRRQVALNTLAFVAAILAIWKPLVLWEVGFQLSFLATLGLILYGGIFMAAAENFINHRFSTSAAQHVASFLGQFVFLTLAAQLTTLPIIAYHFKQISLVSPIANAFVLPAQPAVMVIGGLAVSLSLLIYPLGQLAAWVAWPLTAYTIRMVEFFDRVPHAVVSLGGFSPIFVFLFYALLFAVTFAGAPIKDMYRTLRQKFRYLSLSMLLLALLVATMLIWRLVAASPDGKLHITLLSVGSADAALIQTPAGRNILVNGGPSVSVTSDALGRRLPPFDHTLDWVVLASTDENQVASLPRLLPRYPPRNVLLGGPPEASFSSGALMRWLADQTIAVTRAEEGQALDLGKGARLRVLNVSPRGSTLLVEWKAFRALLPIGADFNTLDQLEYGVALGPVPVLTLAQSGYAPLTPPSWIENLNPHLVVISVAPADKDGLPDKATLDALDGYSVLRTDLSGWIEITTDGDRMWVLTEKSR